MLALLTDEQEMLKQVAGTIAAAFGLTNPGDLDTVDRGKGWAALADAGLLGIRGGEPNSGVEVMVVAQEMGATLTPLPFGPGGVLVPDLLARAGASPEIVEGVASGTERYGILLSADLLGLADADAARVVAWGGAGATHVLALRRGDQGVQVTRLPLQGFVACGSADLTSPLLRSEDPARRGESDILGGPLNDDDLARWSALALVVVTADLVGAIRSALHGVVEYSKQRIAYDAPIGSFQALQHLCADALKCVEAAASTLNYAAWAVDELPASEALLAARTAKAYAASVGLDVAETVMQVYGGIGHTWEHIAHFYTRRVLVDLELFGAEAHQLTRIADAVLAGN
jgi:hypothetical protein